MVAILSWPVFNRHQQLFKYIANVSTSYACNALNVVAQLVVSVL